MTDELQDRPLREMVWLLREFEDWRCLWRVPVAGAASAAPGLLALGGAVTAIYIGADLKLYRVVLGAIVSLSGSAAAGLIARRKPWRAIFARRLWTYEAPSARTRLEVLVRDEDSARAWHALRRSRFVPLYGAVLVVPPPDALDLNNRIGVQEPEEWMRSTSDEDRIRRVAAVFGAARIRARVCGRDVFPGGRIEPLRTDEACGPPLRGQRASSASPPKSA
jgi:hypothetical protein